MDLGTRIYVAGSETLVGKALCQRLARAGYRHLVGISSQEPDLTERNEVEHFFAATQPDVVFLAAGMSGGIEANQKYPADLMVHNLLAVTHILEAAARRKVKKLLYLGSSCMYPRLAHQPLEPQMLHTGILEPTNAAYATAKLAGLALSQAYRHQSGAPFISAIPANVFGPHDDFSLASAHVVPALLRKMHAAKLRGDNSVAIWGSGAARRDFLFAPDLADACMFLTDHYDGDVPINIGSGADISIGELAVLVADVVGYRGELRFDKQRPDGMPRKYLDTAPLLALGWKAATPLRQALETTYTWFVTQDADSMQPYAEEENLANVRLAV